VVSIKVSDENLKIYLKKFFISMKDTFTSFFVSFYIFSALCMRGVKNIYNKSSGYAKDYKGNQIKKHKQQIRKEKQDIELLRLKKQKKKLQGKDGSDDLSWSPFN